MAELDLAELGEAWWLLDAQDRIEGFRLLDATAAEEFFFDLDSRDQAELLLALPPAECRRWLRLLPPDDAVDLVQEAPEELRAGLVALLDETMRREVMALLAYAEDEAGGLMSSRFARVRPDMTIDEAITYLRRQAAAKMKVETLYYIYVLEGSQRLLGILSFRDLFAAPGNQTVREVMEREVVSVPEEMDQEAVARVFAEHDLFALPVVDTDGLMKGIVTVDDIVDVVEEEATEDIQKYGGMEALDEPYLRIDFFSLIRKRAGWLAVLFVGEMLTATAMVQFQDRIKAAYILAIFIPLVISSGGNSGSQASTLIIRAMAVGEVRLRDWWRVARRELAAGLALGVVLGTIALVRVIGAHALGLQPHDHFMLVAVAVAFSLLGVVLFGTIAGSMLPIVLRRLGLDPASASAPFVATLVDVTGIVIYFTVTGLVLAGVRLPG